MDLAADAPANLREPPQSASLSAGGADGAGLLAVAEQPPATIPGAAQHYRAALTLHAEIARWLYLSIHAIETHLRHVCQTLGIRSRRELERPDSVLEPGDR